VYPSEANYFLCKYGNNVSGRELAEYLLEKHSIFIKDLTGKKGIPGGSYIRLAVRSEKDNMRLIDALRSFANRNNTD
jgi:histidinol-phosphate/aromatic aminotransferase/cobyric acid decarboxylase-like protein